MGFVELKNLVKSYGSSVRALDRVTFDVERGEWTGVNGGPKRPGDGPRKEPGPVPLSNPQRIVVKAWQIRTPSNDNVSRDDRKILG